MSKSIAKNALFNTAYKALSVVFPLITISYASRILGPNGMGNVSSAQNLVSYFVMIASLGIPSYGVRLIAQKKKVKGECNKAFTELFIINLVATAISTIFYFMFVFYFGVLDNLEGLNIIFSLLILCNVFNIDWVYQAMEEYKYIAYRSFAIKLVSLAVLLLFVKTERDIYIYAGINCFGTVGNYFLNMVQLKKYVQFRFKKLSFKLHINPIMVFFASVIAIELYSMIDVTMLTYMTDSAHVGYYTNSSRVVKTFSGTITAIGAVLLPRLSIYFIEKRYKEIEKVVYKMLRILLLITIPACIGIIFVSDDIVKIMFGNEFLPAIKTIQILSPLVIFMPLSGGIAAQILQTTNNEKKYLWTVCMGAMLNFLLNIILIIPLLQNGAAVASVITEALVTMMMLVFCTKIIRFKIEKRFIIEGLLAIILMIVLLIGCEYIFREVDSFIRVTIEIIGACSIYIIVLALMKNVEINTIFEFIRGKLKK